ncbi:MAG: hypothetical protein L0Y70_25725, partial [Gemmataceae bacterium]|nr:hypothetical protein [Gemmataceae bacterium]
MTKFFRRQQPITHKPNRSRRFLLEQLEDRIALSGLFLSLAESTIDEGFATTATVSRTGDVSGPMAVTLYSSDTTEATVPQSVVIPAGQTSVDFLVTAEEDDEADGIQSANIYAEANAPPTFELLTATNPLYMTRTIATLPDGRFVTAGLKYVGTSPWSFDVAVSRFLPGGQLDTSFS